MARQSAATFIAVVLAAAALSVTSAQDTSPASAPAPSLETGAAGLSLAVSGGAVVCSLLVSLFALLRH